MMEYLERFERFIAWVLTILLVLVILLATVDLAVDLVKNALYVAPRFLIGTDQLLKLFGLFLLILLGLELLETLKAYFRDDLIHVEVVLIVAMIALARKVIILEFKETSPLILVGAAALMLALGISYRLIIGTLRND
jgi:uncharacterized membrane protein (DUF373 family)